MDARRSRAGTGGVSRSGVRALSVLIQARGAKLVYPIAVANQLAMSLICLLFVILCVRSFIAARGSRQTAA